MSCRYFSSVILTLYFFSFSMLSHSRGPLGAPSFAYYSQIGSDHSPGELILQLDGSWDYFWLTIVYTFIEYAYFGQIVYFGSYQVQFMGLKAFQIPFRYRMLNICGHYYGSLFCMAKILFIGSLNYTTFHFDFKLAYYTLICATVVCSALLNLMAWELYVALDNSLFDIASG